MLIGYNVHSCKNKFNYIKNIFIYSHVIKFTFTIKVETAFHEKRKWSGSYLVNRGVITDGWPSSASGNDTY